MSQKRINLGYVPREYQRDIHKDPSRFRVVVAHRRFGKTYFSIAELVDAALRCKLDAPRFAFIAPLHKQAKLIAWDYLQAFCRPLPGYDANQAELRVDFMGRRIQLFGADNPDALRGQYLDGCILDEYAQMDPRTWTEVVRPALSDRKGWAVWIGTPAGPNAFRDLYEQAAVLPGWSRYLFRADQTGVIDEDELAAARREMDESAYAQEYLCDFSAAVKGAYYGRQMQDALESNRITNVPHDPQWPVETWWDLGMRDHTVVWFVQRIGAQVRLIDLYANTGSPIDHYAQVLDDKPYTYSRHIAPHDIEVRELGTGKSRRQIASELGLDFETAPKLKIQDGINASRMLIPRCWIDAEKCKVGIEALQLYRAKYNEKERVFQATPLHDWCFTGDTEILTSHGKCRIIDLPPVGKVLTSCGYKQYVNPRITRKRAQLVEVRFEDGLSVRCTPDHLFKTASGWISAELLKSSTQIQSASMHSHGISMAGCTAYSRVAGLIRRVAESVCTALCGWARSVIYRTAALSTTGMRTNSTTALETWSACQEASIKGSTSASGQTTRSPRKRGMPPQNGISRKKDDYGTADMQKKPSPGQSGSEKAGRVSIAAKTLRRLFGSLGVHRNTVATSAKPLRITSVVHLSKRQDVWCLTVPSAEEFALSNGAIVHNCSHYADAFRTGAVMDADPEWEDLGNVAVPSAHTRRKHSRRVSWNEPIPYGR